MVGGMRPLAIVRTENTASTAPAAVSVWPTIDLFDEIGTDFMRSPMTATQPIDSILAFSRTSAPAPSPMTKPSRFLENGFAAPSGGSFWVDRADNSEKRISDSAL